ncbi:MAG: hypothetical protein AB7T27_04400 [Kiritimatiellia bacterium]
MIAVFGIETWCRETFPSRYPSHDVDRLLYDLDTHTYNADTVVLGDSVGRQISKHLARQRKEGFLPLATNGFMEMAGQYYIFLRYLERNRPPASVVLLMHRPLHGDLSQPATENYVQRSFTRWHEIAGLTLSTGSPGFGLRTLSYRLAAAKYRLHLQKLVPGLPEPRVTVTPQTAEMREDRLSKKNPLMQLLSRVVRRDPASISERYFLSLLDECRRRHIRVYYLPCPVTERQWIRYEHGPAQTQLVPRMMELSRQYSNLVYTTEIRTYPGDWFADGLHIRRSRLAQVAGDYALMMDGMMRQ